MAGGKAAWGGSARARWELARELPRAGRWLTVAVVATSVFGALRMAAFAVASGVAVGAVPEAVTGGFDSPPGRRLVGGLAAAGAVFLLGQLVAAAQGGLISALARRLRNRTFRRSMAAVLRPPTIVHLEDPAMQDRVAAATTLSPTGPRAAVQSLIGQWRQLLSGLSALALVATWRWPIAVLLLVTQLALRRRNARSYNQLIAFRTTHLPELRRAVYFRELAMRPDAAKETRIFGLGGWVVDRFRQAWLGPMVEMWRRRRGNFLVMLTGALPVIAVEALAYWLLGRAVIRGEIGVGALTTYAQGVMFSVQLSIAGDDMSIDDGAATVRAARELEEVVATDPRLTLPGDRPADGLPRHEVRFERVAFRYPGQERDVLAGLDLVIPAGRSLAIVGENGAGKTTLVKLLARLYDPTAGRITVDGTDLTELDARSWQRRQAGVLQDFVRYPLTAAENVGFGRAGPEELTRAAERAGAGEIVEGLPAGWDTVLTREFEGGVDLSGGEWQRIALARALFAAEAAGNGVRATHAGNGVRATHAGHGVRATQAGGGILLLDEPTAHLDARAEAAFIDRFLDVTAGCTTIVISHRFSTVRRADRIAVLEGGQIVESGSHDELIAARGRYAALFALQAERFQHA